MSNITLKWSRPDGSYVGDITVGAQTWPYHFIPDEVETWQLAQDWLAENPAPLPPEPPPPPAPTFGGEAPEASLTPLQAAEQLWDSGLLEPFEAWLAKQDPRTRNRWRHGAGFAREGSVLVAGLAALGQSAEQIAAFYRAAAQRSPLG